MQRREKRELREQEIIKNTIELLSQRGFLDVRMSDIAKGTQYSMGTIYSHFETKEDLLLACAHTLVLEHKDLLLAIQKQTIPAIEKIITMVQCSWHMSMQHPDLIEIDNLSMMPSVWRRATETRADRLNQLHVELANMFLDIALDAIEESLDGHAALDKDETERLAHHLTHGMWGLCVGLSSTAQSGYASTLCPESSEGKYTHFTTNYSNFLKGYGWHETDPEALFERCKADAHKVMNQTIWFKDHQTEQHI
ncbi:TetR/AcrR family transcriptional regulator [Mariprofundus sp. EBB-1]|uniref:TetR/AcrR family transcriptional regulator n=1 Tax=Mariprofundus sp. EBB-1 TaxID=2650971 RepID=UPI000EF25A94|nr:TetR/AcrR family transcriptional regulator [Mariprofundus sp. EBB-1]RLL53260.1 TetR/AcrR family transcriptional regulator [Mariprofundus sp. EBB-1]